MPAGIVRSILPTAVLPLSLSRAFVESQAYPARVNEYHDGSSQRTAMLPSVRRSWQLAKHLPAATMTTLREFWQAQGLGGFYFYNPKETVPPFSYDPTGAATAGRYRVRFARAWNQSQGVGLLDGGVDLVELLSAHTVAPFSVFGTGVDADMNPAAGGNVDVHWALVSGPDATYPGPDMLVMVGRPGAYVAIEEHGLWISNRPYSGSVACPTGIYTLEHTFSLAGFDPATARISGVWGVDNIGSLYLNGVLISTHATFAALQPFDIATGFRAGANTLRAVVENTFAATPNPMGVLLSIEEATAEEL